MNVRKLVLSKWLYYVLIAVVLLALFLYFLPSAAKSDDISANFLSEIWGLFFTLLIFFVLLDFREVLEWKSVEDRVKKRIGKRANALFGHLSIFCEVERVHFDPLSEEERLRFVDRQIETLASEEIRLTAEAKRQLLNENIKRSYEIILDSARNFLGRVEERYSRFLDPEVRTALMDIQDYLELLIFEFKVPHLPDEVYFKTVSALIGEIMKEILKLKRKGFWKHV